MLNKPSDWSGRINSTQITSYAVPVYTLIACLIANAFIGGSTARAASESPPLSVAVTQELFPPGDLRITSDGSSAGQVVFQFDNVDPQKTSGKAESQMYMVAGIPGKVPTVKILSAHYTRYLRGQPVQDVEGLPPGFGNSDASSVVRLADLGQLRHLHVYTMTVITSQMATEPGWQDSSWVLRQMRIRIDLGAPPSTSGQRPDEELVRAESAFLRTQVLNANIGPSYWIKPAGLDFSRELEWCRLAARASKAGSLYRFPIYAGGLYTVSPDDLKKLDRNSTNVATGNPSKWRVYRNGNEVPVFQPNDAERIVLPVSPDDFQVPNEVVYWLLTSADGQSSQPARLNLQLPKSGDGTASEEPASTTISLETVAARLEDYHARLRPTSTTTRWYWKSIVPQVTGLFDVELPSYYAAPAETSVEMNFGFPNYTANFPGVRLFVNTEDCGLTTVSAQQGSIAFTVPPGVLRPGKNVCGLRLEYATEIGALEVLVQALRFRWQQPLVAAPSTAFQLGVTSPSQHLMLPMPNSNSSLAPPLISFSPAGAGVQAGGISAYKGVQQYAALPGASRYIFLHDGSTTTVSTLRRVTDFAEPLQHEVDYVAVIAPDLIETIQPLLRGHESRGLKVLGVDATHVIDQFNFGQRDGEAIRRFLQYLDSTAKLRKPKYLLLTGECSDYRGNLALIPPGSQADMVPTIGPYVAEGMHGDHGFSRIAGEDMVADLAVGRLSVSTPGDLAAMLEKFEGYRTRPLGDWMFRAQFLYDDNDEFPRVVENVITRSMAPPAEIHLIRQSDYTYVPNLRVPGRRRSHEATTAVINDFNYGAAVQNFFGHGGPNLWSHERVLHMMDLPKIHNANRLPLVTCLSCDNAWMDYPVSPAPGRVGVSSSMGEMLVRKADGGAIGLFGPVAGASPYEHQTLVARLMESVYRQEERRLGTLTMYAKNMYYNETRSSALPEQYILLGDPALELRVPLAQPGLEHEPKTLSRDRTTTVKLLSPGAETTATIFVRSMAEETYIANATKSAPDDAVELRPSGPASVSLQVNEVTTEGLRSRATRMPVESVSPGEATAEVIQIGEASNPEFANLQLEAVSPPTPTGVPNEHEVPVLRFVARASAKGDVTSTSAFLQNTSGSLTDTISIPALKKGNTQPIGFTLKQTLTAGAHEMELVLVRGSGDDTTTDIRKLAVQVAPLTDLEFVAGTARARSTTGFTQRSTVFIDAVLKNNGSVPARIITLHALLGDPESGVEAQSINDVNSMTVDGLEPGEERLVTFRWENTTDSGDMNVHLLVNRTRSVAESSYDNNSIAVPTFTMKRLGNFSVRSMRYEPLVATPGEKVRIVATFANDGDTTRGPVDVEIGLRNAYTDETTSIRTTIVALGAEETITKELLMEARYNVVYTAINPSRELEELNADDNVAVGRTMLALPASSLRTDPKLPISFNRIFDVSRTYSMDPISTDVLEISDNYTSTAGMQSVDPKWLLNGQVRTAETRNSAADDNLWSFDLFKLEAGRNETAGEVNFRIPVADSFTEWPFAVYANVAVSLDFQGGPIGNFAAKLGGGKWHDYNFAARQGTDLIQRVILTTTTLTNGNLDVSLRHTSGSAVIISGFEAIPQVGGIESPIILLDRASRSGHVLTAHLRDVHEDQVWMQVRTGTRSEGAVQWRNWSTRSGTKLDIRAAAGDAMQWRVFVQPYPGTRPLLADITLAER